MYIEISYPAGFLCFNGAWFSSETLDNEHIYFPESPSEGAALAKRFNGTLCDSGILWETDNLYLNPAMEICLNGVTHAIVIGKAKSVAQAKITMRRLETYPQNLEHLRNG